MTREGAKTMGELGLHNTGRDSWSADVEARVAAVEARARQVFGNDLDAAVWQSRFDPRIGRFQIRDAIKSEAGAAAALLVLDELAKTVIPVAREIPKHRPRRRR